MTNNNYSKYFFSIGHLLTYYSKQLFVKKNHRIKLIFRSAQGIRQHLLVVLLVLAVAGLQLARRYGQLEHGAWRAGPLAAPPVPPREVGTDEGPVILRRGNVRSK